MGQQMHCLANLFQQEVKYNEWVECEAVVQILISAPIWLMLYINVTHRKYDYVQYIGIVPYICLYTYICICICVYVYVHMANYNNQKED